MVLEVIFVWIFSSALAVAKPPDLGIESSWLDCLDFLDGAEVIAFDAEPSGQVKYVRSGDD